MTKKLLGGLFVGLLFAALGSAATVVENPCTITGGFAQGPGTPTITGTAVCNGFTLPTNNTLISVELFIRDDYQLGNQGANTLIYTYSVTNFSMTSITSTVTGTDGSAFYNFGWTGSNSCTTGTGVTGLPSAQTGDCMGTPGGTVIGNQVQTITLTGTGTWASGSAGLGTNGSSGFTVSARFTYADLSAPEPASMLLVGGGLIGLALAGRKKFRA